MAEQYLLEATNNKRVDDNAHASGFGSFEGAADALRKLAEARALYEQIKSMQSTGESSASTSASNNSAHTVTINIGSQSSQINVASQADGAALTALLQQLADAKARA